MTDASPLALLSIDQSSRIARLTLNRPDQRNALSIELLAAMHARLDELTADFDSGGDDAPTVLVVTGAGRSFCAGMDLKQVLHDPAGSGTSDPARLLTALAELALRLRALPCVTIAAVNGAAIGGGCGLATVTDLAITHADAKLGFPEVDLGLCPAVVAPWLVRKIGAGRARAVLLRGGVMTGCEAHARGIVDEVADTADALAPAVAAAAERLAAGGPLALLATKGLLNELDGSLDADLARRGAGLSASVLATPEAQAALRARLTA